MTGVVIRVTEGYPGRSAEVRGGYDEEGYDRSSNRCLIDGNGW